MVRVTVSAPLFQVTLNISGSSGPLVVVPAVTLPVNTTGCETPPPSYSNDSLITPCDITPYIASSVLVPNVFDALVCTHSPAPNCSSVTCSVPESKDNVTFTFVPCAEPPAVTVENFVNGTRSRHTFSRFLRFNFSSKRVPMNVSLIQHTDKMSLGFKVHA